MSGGGGGGGHSGTEGGRTCDTYFAEEGVFFKTSACPGGGGGGTQVQRGAAPAIRISWKKGSFLRPPHVRDFVKEGYFFVPRYEVWGSKSPYNPRLFLRGNEKIPSNLPVVICISIRAWSKMSLYLRLG